MRDLIRPKIELRQVSKSYPTDRGAVLALRDTDLAVADGEFVAIVGPSGCGKSTLIYIVGGFLPAEGEVLVDGRAITGPSTERGVVFQEYALFPWYTVRENVRYGLRRKRVPDAEQRRLVDHYIGLVGLRGFERRYPRELSGGMRQRVSIARALAVNPSVLLMDEPFAALDIQTREYMQDELLKIWQRERQTVIFVTHSIDEAIKLSDRIAIMTQRPGRFDEIKTVNSARPRDPENPAIVHLAAEVKRWLQRQISERERAIR